MTAPYGLRIVWEFLAITHSVAMLSPLFIKEHPSWSLLEKSIGAMATDLVSGSCMVGEFRLIDLVTQNTKPFLHFEDRPFYHPWLDL